VNIVQITPGAGGMYCGNCFRDNALVAELRRLGHQTLMVPLYLPMTLDEEDQSAGTPIFFGGVNFYLEQKSALFRRMPEWLHRLLNSPRLLTWAAGRAAKTRAEEVGDITISMLRGEEGNQARELEELIRWLKAHPAPDIICLSNALLLGLARRLKRELRSKVVCMLQGEDYFLNCLPEETRDVAWNTLSERAADADLFIAPSRYFGGLMSKRLNLSADGVRVIFNGIHLDGYGPADEPFVASLRERLRANGVLHDVEFHPNLSRSAKREFLHSLTVFSVPALYGEAFGLYVIEALASGVPVVQPRTASFPELIEATGGGVLYEPGDPQALADAVEGVLARSDKLPGLGEVGRKAVFERFNAEHMARQFAEAFQALLHRFDHGSRATVAAV